MYFLVLDDDCICLYMSSLLLDKCLNTEGGQAWAITTDLKCLVDKPFL